MRIHTDRLNVMCTRPLRFWKSNVKNPKTGKWYGFVTGYDVNEVTAQDFKRRDLPVAFSWYVTRDYVEVPCGHCPECLKARKYAWLGRCLAECECHKYNYFVTLTYDDIHLVAEPKKEEVQNFINRLRKWIKLRYLAVGEKGDLNDRAHYHLILFCDEPLEDLKLLKRGLNPLYRSEILEHCWDHKGYVSVGFASGPSVAYSLGYLVQKEKKTCFKLQSQGLGAEYFSTLEDRYYLGNGKGQSVTVALPRYLKEKYGITSVYDLEMQRIRWKNRVFPSKLSEEDYRSFSEYITQCPVRK